MPKMNLAEKIYVIVVSLAAPILLILGIVDGDWLLAVLGAAAVVMLLVWWSSRRRSNTATATVTEEEIAAIIARSPDHNGAVAALRQAHPGLSLTDAHLMIQSRAGAAFEERRRAQDNETGS